MLLHRLIQFALSQRLFVLIAILVLIGAGIQAFRAIPIDAFPNVSTPQIKIILKAPGMTPQEVESRITAPVEVEMLGIPHQVMLRSQAKYGLTSITVDFAAGTDIYWARQQVAERLNGVRDKLPPEVTGGIAPLTTPLGEMFMFTIEGGGLTLMAHRELLDWVLRPALRTVPGVADVNALGGYVKTFEVVPDQTRMLARGVSFAELRQTLGANNRNDGAGRIAAGEETLRVRSAGSIQTLEDVRAIVVKAPSGVPIRVADVATVRLGSLTRYGGVTRDGEGEVVQGLVLGLRGANARELVAGVQDKLAALKPSLPEGVEINVFYNRGNLVERAVSTVSNALLQAVALVILLLVLLLGNLRAAATVAITLPLVALTTFILMRVFGLSANLMSLGGLAIAIGLLVDAAVVVVENITTTLARPGSARLPRLHLVYRAVREVAVPVTSGTLIIILVFLPLLTLQGLEGKLFIPVALTIVFALAGSLLLSLTVIPVLASLLIARQGTGEPRLARWLVAAYRPVLNWSLRHGRWVVVLAVLALLVTGWAYTRIGKTFMPTMNEGSLIIQLEKLPSITLAQSLQQDLRVQQALLEQVPEVVGVIARTGSDEIGMDPMGLNETDSFLLLKPRDEWRMATQAALIDELRQVMEGFPGIQYGFTQPIDMRVAEMLTGVRGDVAVKLFGPDLATLNRKAQAMVQVLEQIEGSEDVLYTVNEGVQYLQVNLDRLAIGRLGLDVIDVQERLRAQLEGSRVGTIYRADRRIPLMIKGADASRESPATFAGLSLAMPNGSSVPLTHLAELTRVEGPVQIERELGQRMTVITLNVSGRDLVGFVAEARRTVQAQVPLEMGYRVAWGGEFENQQRAAARLAVVVPVALGLIFILLFTTFGRVRQALLILLNIPFALIGGVFALWLTGEYLSVPASVGFIALLGIAVMNAVVLVEYFNHLRQQGLAMATAVRQGAERRLRPVLMTASSTLFGLIPLSFATGPGAEVQRPLAIVVIGGVITSTFLTLVLLPVLYQWFGEAKRHRFVQDGAGHDNPDEVKA